MSASFLIVAFVGAVLAIACGFSLDLMSRRADIHRITDWPFRDMPATNGAIFAVLFIAAVLGVLSAVAHGFHLI